MNQSDIDRLREFTFLYHERPMSDYDLRKVHEVRVYWKHMEGYRQCLSFAYNQAFIDLVCIQVFQLLDWRPGWKGEGKRRTEARKYIEGMMQWVKREDECPIESEKV